MQVTQHNHLWHSGLNIQLLTTLTTVMSTFLCALLLNYSSKGEKWFSNKGDSVCKHPRVLPCLSKAPAGVKKTDRGSLSTWFSVMTLIIYLVAAMTTVVEAWCVGFHNTLTTTFSLMTHLVLAVAWDSRRETQWGNTGEAKVSAWCFEVLFIRRLLTGKEERKMSLEIHITVFDNLCKHRI